MISDEKNAQTAALASEVFQEMSNDTECLQDVIIEVLKNEDAQDHLIETLATFIVRYQTIDGASRCGESIDAQAMKADEAQTLYRILRSYIEPRIKKNAVECAIEQLKK